MTRLDQLIEQVDSDSVGSSLRYELRQAIQAALDAKDQRLQELEEHNANLRDTGYIAQLERERAKLQADLTKVRREAKWAMEWIDGRIYGQKIWHASKDPDYQRAKAFLSQPEIQALEEQL